MKIKMLCSISGEWIASKGHVVDRPEAEALRLIAAGFAVAELTEAEAAAKVQKASKVRN